MVNSALKVNDSSLREGQQCVMATRMRTEDMTTIATEINKVGYNCAEVWGGATFDVALRYLNEDPWDRVRALKKLMPDTPLRMLLRGQNLVGFRHYADDVVDAFIRHAAQVGIDVFRVFDTLNDERNLEVAVNVIKACGKKCQIEILYSITELTLGGPVYNIDYYVHKALTYQDMGADIISIGDPAGLISPYDAYGIVKSLKKVLRVPLQIIAHCSGGMAETSYLKAIEAGVDIVDTVLAPFALRSSIPAVEPIVVSLKGAARDTKLDLNHIIKIGKHIELIAPKYREFLDSTSLSVIDPGVLTHQIPGGMSTNFVYQLRELNALNRIEEVREETSRVRKELGHPPLGTPLSQIVGDQAVDNVIHGRYKTVSNEVRDYVYGMYGRPLAPIDPNVQEIIREQHKQGPTPISCRPADLLKPELDKAKAATKDIARDMGDVLIYALYPNTGMHFLRSKYGLATQGNLS